jgi:spore maturation protein CgeB
LEHHPDSNIQTVKNEAIQYVQSASNFFFDQRRRLLVERRWGCAGIGHNNKPVERGYYSIYIKTLPPRAHKRFQAIRKIDTEGRSLKSFDEQKCIFVHITKCAGVSVSKSLFGNLGGGHMKIGCILYRMQPIFDILSRTA